MIYYTVAALLLCAAALPQGPARLAAACYAAIFLFAFGGLRFEVGTDWDSYLDVFEAVAQGESFADMREEAGFLGLVFVFQLFSKSYPAFIFSLFVLSLSVKLYAIFRFKADIVVALIVYFCSVFLIYDVNGLRQGLALGFALCAGWYAVKSRVYSFIIAMALAISVHTVALVALPIYWLANVNWFNRQRIRLRCGIAAGAVVFSYALSWILASTDISVYLELVNLTSRYNHYVDNFDTKFSPLGLGSLQRIFVLGVALIMQNRLACPRRVSALLVNTYVVATCIFFALSFNIEFMARVSFYYKIFDIILIAMISKTVKSQVENALFITLLGMLLFGSISQILSIPDGGLLPYKFQTLR